MREYASPPDKERMTVSGRFQCLFDGLYGIGLGLVDLRWIARHDDVVTVGQGLGQRFPSVSSHDDGLTESRFAEAPHVLGMMGPRQTAIMADRAIGGMGHDEGNAFQSISPVSCVRRPLGP